jgi:hypothetical protein
MEKIVKYLNIYVLASFLFFVFHDAKAANELAQTFTLDGHLTQKATTDALLDSSAKIVVQVLDPSKNCILYEEQQTVDTTSSAGYFSIQVGSNTGSTKRTTNDAGLTMAQVFQNTSSIVGKDASGKTCPVDGGTGFPTYVPTAKDIRYFRLTVTPSSTNTADVLSPDIEIGSTPSSLVAQTFQGYIPTQFLFVGTGDLTQANVQSIFATGNAAKLTTLLATDPSLYLARNATSGLVQMPSGSGTPTGVAAGQMWYDTGVLKYYDGTTVQTLGVAGAGIGSITAGTGLTGGTISTSGQTIAVDVGTTASKIVQLDGSAKLPAVDGSALTNLNAGKIAGNAVSSTTLVVGDAGKMYVWDGAALTAKYVSIGDLKKSSGVSQFADANCAASQTITWSAVTDSFTCSNISGLDGSVISAGTVAAARMPAFTGDATSSAGSTALTLATVGVAKGGTGSTTLTAGSILVGNGTSALSTLAGGTTGNVIYATSASAWASGTPDTAGVVDKSSAQTITGAKTFTLMKGTAFSVAAPATTGIDFDNGNTAYTAVVCAGATWTVSNMAAGTMYMVAVQGTAHTGTCAFSDGSSTFKYQPTNATPTNAKDVIYSMIKIGSVVYVSWIDAW